MRSTSGVTPMLMFTGQADEAMKMYMSLIQPSEAGPVSYQENGMVLHASFYLRGQRITCIDSAVKHAFDFTPSISLCLECQDVEELDMLFEELSRDGKVLMSLGPIPGSERFGWVQDRFGVSWQLSLPESA